MPKMKTDRGAAKRIKVTASGRLRRRKAFRSHILEKKSSVRDASARPRGRHLQGGRAGDAPDARHLSTAIFTALPAHTDLTHRES